MRTKSKWWDREYHGKRVVLITPWSKYWIGEAGSRAFGLGFAVTRFTGDQHRQDGWTVTVDLGPWQVNLYDAGGYRAVHGDDAYRVEWLGEDWRDVVRIGGVR